ncbi:TfdA family Taurine catabolism dioxygenase TauD [Colletotrichum abscissum]|uniref:TfdA family Taurine catabolism dioxygenase TauD n=1 Tax=Colletotrichum abscissum TaxID=1671311 RepID=UPI0027D6E734|nr:TfdA family Taurine catabolism dioxygenase TauD [Colletotrichum abscissum]KAK1473559.1 TfdA family Taurine catabolism dioxygenase TauD [Colletotrichum abscissum]
MAWDGSSFANRPELYTDVLTEVDLEEIKDAIKFFKKQGLPRGSIDRTSFPLSPGLSQRVQGISDILNDDRGFHVVRGIDPSQFSDEDHVLLFAGLSAHVASNRAGYIHAGAIVALFTESNSQLGGEQYLSSFWRVYNALALEAPQVIQALASNWHWEKPDRKDPNLGNLIYPQRAIIGHIDGRVQINYGRSFVAGHEKYPLSAQAPHLTDFQISALDLLSKMAEKHAFQLDTQPGDLLFVNNLSIMHARGAFRDGPECNPRHVMRLWLQDQGSWPVAPTLKYKEEVGKWNVAPEDQKLYDLGEWKQTARPLEESIYRLCYMLQPLFETIEHDWRWCDVANESSLQ